VTPHNVPGGDSVMLGGQMALAPKVGIEGGRGYMLTERGMQPTGTLPPSYAEETARARALGGYRSRTGGYGAPTQPSQEAVDHLRLNPHLAADFDRKYGQGAAAEVLGR
jgi:hypothetical protein